MKFSISKTWNIGVFKEETPFQLTQGANLRNLVFSLSGRKLRKRYRHNAVYADPFLFQNEGKLYLFAEVQPIGEAGYIHCWQYKQGSEWEDRGPVLKESTHYSYPFIFKDTDGKIYMIPESHQTREISLWEFTNFPLGLKKVKKILEGFYVDSNIFLYHDVYYLFTKSEKEQLIFYTDNLLSGTWTPHPANPVTKDPKTNRNGGGVILHENVILRIAQNTTNQYGEGIVILKVLKVDKENYEELILLDDYKPARNYAWQKKGRHHLSICEFQGSTYVAMDGLANNIFINVFINAFYKILGNGLFNRGRRHISKGG